MTPERPSAPVVLRGSKTKLLPYQALLVLLLLNYVRLVLTGSVTAGVVGIVVFGFVVASSVRGLLDRRPPLIADAHGVTDRRSRFLAWSDVETISIAPLRPAIMFVLDRKNMRVMVFRARPGVPLSSPRWWAVSRSLYGKAIMVLQVEIAGTLESVSGDIQRLSGRDVEVRPS